MKESSSRLLANAEETIHAAESLLEDGYLRDATNRAYYGMFYIAEALLSEKEVRLKKHGGLHGAFALQYIKTGIFDAKYHERLVRAFNRRMVGDYDESARLASEDVRETIAWGWDFLAEAKKCLGVK